MRVCSHHPAPAGLYPCHSVHEEIGGCAQVLLLYSGDGDCGGEGHVYRYGFFVIQGSNLSVWYMCAVAVLKVLTIFWRLGRFHCDIACGLLCQEFSSWNIHSSIFGMISMETYVERQKGLRHLFNHES